MMSKKVVSIDHLERVILDAGDLLIKFWSERPKLKIDYKEGQGLVSNADKEVEAFLIKELSILMPEAAFCAEESSYENSYDVSLLKKGWSWVIDPLDGTNNFLSGFDYFCISVSLCLNGLPEIGVVYRPIRGDFFIAEKGKGAFFENKQISLPRTKIIRGTYHPNKLKDSLLCTGFAGEKGIKFEKEFEVFKKMMMNSRGVRRLGSAALDLSYLAKGSWQGFWEKGLSPWDVAAAGLICQEAGIEVVDLQGQAFSPFNASIVACAPSIKSELLVQLNG